LLPERFLLITFVWLVALGGSATSASEPTLSVCTAASSAQHLDGKIVRVRGVLKQASPSAAFFDELFDDSCSEIKIHVISADSSFLAHAPKGYKPDPQSVERVQHLAAEAAVKGRDLTATVQGVFSVQKKEDYVQQRHKWYPLVLVIQGLSDVKER
jgi:hypothetical protein